MRSAVEFTSGAAGAQKTPDFGAFWISDFQLRDVHSIYIT
jgi:hypothetical protein